MEQDTRLMDQGDQAMSQGRFQDAETAYQEYLHRYPRGKERWKGWQRLVTISRDMRNNMVQADKLLTTIFQEFRSDPDRAVQLLIQQAKVNMALGDPEAALANLEKGNFLKQMSSTQRWNLLMAQAQTAFKAHRFPLAHGFLVEALPLAPDQKTRAQAVHLDGQALIHQGAYTEAEQLLSGEFAGMTAGPMRARIGLALVDIAEQQGRNSDGLQLLQQIKTEYPNPRALEIREKILQEKISKKG
jgi:tetratricopeptide (TPR) repeat protein